MSNTVIQQTEQMCFHFDNQVKRRNLQEATEYNTRGTRLENNYLYVLQTLKLVDYNTKGLFQNIIYTTTLIKKGLLNISIDIYLENIINRLIHNYKFQIINEFSLLKQFIAFGNRTMNRNTFATPRPTNVTWAGAGIGGAEGLHKAEHISVVGYFLVVLMYLGCF